MMFFVGFINVVKIGMFAKSKWSRGDLGRSWVDLTRPRGSKIKLKCVPELIPEGLKMQFCDFLDFDANPK